MTEHLSSLLIETGLLQFGRFQHQGRTKPYRLSLDLLPSYPDVLSQIAEQAHSLVNGVDHLLSAPDALPLGLSLSLRTQIPLVYARGTQDAAVYDLAGAYDIGHPALLVANSLDPSLYALVHKAEVVGLETQAILTIVDEGQMSDTRINIHALLNLEYTVLQLAESGELPDGQAQAVVAWIAANRHPG